MTADATELRTVAVYTDYKSPYAYLAKDLAYELERDFPVRIDWLPYRLDIPSFLGSARVDNSGHIIEEQRNAHRAAARRVASPSAPVLYSPYRQASACPVLAPLHFAPVPS
jgi:hypothetical protein